MSLSNAAKSFPTVLLLATFLAGCGFWPNRAANVDAPPTKIDNELPFSNKLPESFQCEMVVTVGNRIRKTLIAKKAERTRFEFDFDTDAARTYLTAAKSFVIDWRRKIYAELSDESDLTAGEMLSDELSMHFLNEHKRGKIEEVSRQDNLIVYRASDVDAPLSEALIYYDETIGMPVKQEFYSLVNGQKVLQYKVEIAGFTTDVADDLFELQKNLRKVSTEEFYQR